MKNYCSLFFYYSYALVHCSCLMNSAPAGAGLKKKKKSSKHTNLSKCGRERGSKPTLSLLQLMILIIPLPHWLFGPDNSFHRV